MASYVVPKKGVEFIFYVGLVSQADTKLFQVNPTIASGDFKVSIDGGALANPATLPAVTPGSSRLVKVVLSTSEMNGDNIMLVGSDAAGAEWCDIIVNIQTAARQIDDLAFPTTSGRSLDVTATGAAGVDWANVENPTTTLDLSGTSIGVATALGTQAKADVNAEVVDVVSTDVIAEAAGVPSATGTISGMLARLYAALRSGVTVTASKKQFKNAAGTVQWEKDVTSTVSQYDETAGNAP